MKIKSFLIFLLISQASLAQTEIEKAIMDAKKTATETTTPNQSKIETESEKLEKKLNEEKEKIQSTTQVVQSSDKKTSSTTADKKAVENVVKLTKEETEMLKRRMKSLKERPDLIVNQNAEAETKNIYSPAPVFNKKSPLQDEKSVHSSYAVERDSNIILSQPISYKDSFTVQMCFNTGLTLTFDESIKTTIQTAIVDDMNMIGAVVAENKRGAYIHLKNPIMDGSYFETAVRLVRKEDDKTYLINIVAQPCPKRELIPFPRVIYLKDKDNASLTIQKRNPLLTPQDTIITESFGYPRIPKKRITVYDMVASPGSEYVVFGVELQMPDKSKEKVDLNNFKFAFLDNLQINKIDSKVEYLAVPSVKVTEMRGVSTLRFKTTVQINKKYIRENRYVYLMFVDKDEKHYQYVPIDTLPYFKSLMDRGFDL